MNQVERSIAVQVDCAANGYIVRPPYDLARDRYVTPGELRVFESFDALVAHLRAVLPIYPALSGVAITTTPPPKGKR